MHIFSIKLKLIVTILLFFVPAIAYADADDDRASTAVTLGGLQ